MKKTTKKKPDKIRRIQLYFSSEDKKTIKKWFGCVRKTYNWVLSCMKKKPKEYKLDVVWLRKRFINKCNIPKDMNYLLDCPKDIRDGALDDLVAAYKLNLDKKKHNPEFKFDIKYKSKKDTQSIRIGMHAAGFNKDKSIHIAKWNEGQFKMFPTRLKSYINFYTRRKDDVIGIPKHDCKLVMNKLGKIYLHVPILGGDNQTPKLENWCGIDPGVRTMMTIYSSQAGVCYKIGDKDISRVVRLGVYLDKLISKCSKSKGRKKKSINKAIIRCRYRIKHIIDDVHWKSIQFLVNTFNTILLPTYKTSQMVKRASRKINSKSVRMMLGWRFYTFKTRLLQKATDYGVNVIECGEEYTSKTCTNCHHIKQNLGGNKVYKCSNCGLIMDRDLNAARNIFIKNIRSSETIN